ncbi:CXC domain-containing protein [Caerostris darwini]|uniref:CXC domain-containing protein n=1 Tax=Caerostris darwini TaxID=1538125 RepID=A0AAV4VGN7_9ARAC|nr:CXC domain-containing protein [Caerostris darwini]
MYSNRDPADDTNQKRNIQKTTTSDSTSNTFKQIFLQSSTSSGCSTSSGSSANANLAWMTSVFSGTNIPDTLVENINSNTINSSDSQIQETRKFTQLINKKQCKRSRNTSNRLNVVKRTLDITGDSASNTTRKSSSNTEEIQKKLQRSELTVESSNTAPTQRINFIPTANSTIAYNTASVPSTISNTVVNNSNTAPLYLILPPNSESSLKNPNYSHYFLILNNNNAQPNQLNLIPSSGVASNANSSTNTQTQKDTLSFSDNNTKNVSQSNILLHQNALQFKQINLGQSSTSTTATNTVNSNVKYHVIPQLILQPNSVAGNSNQSDICFLKPISVASNVLNTSVSMNQSVSASKVHDSTVNSISTSSSQSSYNSEPSASSKADTKTKTLQAKTKQVPPKPIKNISLGKDKYAIQQISIPVKMGDSNKEQNDCIDLHKTNEDYPGGKTISEIKLTENLTPNSKELQINGASNSQVIFNVLPEITNSIKPKHINNINFVPITMNTDSKIKQPTYHILKNTNTVVSNQMPLSVNTQPINVNVFPISETLEMNKNIHSRNTVKLVDIIDNQSTPDSNLEVQNDCVQIKVGNTQNKSLATLQELFPPPISMVPVCIIPPTQTINQVNTSKILILKGPGQQNIFHHKMQINPIPTRLRPNLKKATMKFKKLGRRKTVRELLQERKQTLSKQTNNKMRREIRVLRPILKLPVNTFCQSTTTPTITNVSKLNEASCSTNSTTSTSKRPNILLLPSSSKLAEKNSLDDYLQSVFRNEQEASCSEEFSGVSPYLSSTLNRKDYRPRHYDMSQLNIGYFRVDDDIDSCGRFRSKFKVIFSKRQFLYDFPVSRCNQFGLKSTAVWEQMARIAVSFKSVVSMNLSERTVQISINTPPAITLGRLKARSGVIANATIYDTPVESSSSWGSMIRSTFHHKIVLRKRQAGKLRSFLCHFDDRFITLTSLGVCDNGISNASELSIFEGELSPTTLKKSFSKNKKSGIRRLSRWDSPVSDDLKAFGEEELLLPNQMCSCRISCRSVRCSCVKVAKSCSSICDCINCDNPLNILESIGLNLNFSLSDCCLFQNIYQIPRLISFLKKEVKLTCCNTFAHVQDCIPGTVLCPNIDCNVQVEFSWCRKMVCYPERNPRNHCSFCGQCCFSNGRHCMTCNRCYVVSSKSPGCPTCKEKTPFNSFHEYDKNCHIDQTDRRSENKPNQKPEIIILDSYSLAKTSDTTENHNEVSNMHDSPNIITID